MSAPWFDATCRVEESGGVSPHSKTRRNFVTRVELAAKRHKE
jgi:hypothetical protein